LTRSNKGSEHELFGSIYGDMIFHLHSAMQMENSPEAIYRRRPVDTTSRVRSVVGAAARAVLGRGRYAWLKERLPRRIREPAMYRVPEKDPEREAFERQRHELLENTEAYLHYLRTGRRAPSRNVRGSRL
jgi:hypothetical protein